MAPAMHVPQDYTIKAAVQSTIRDYAADFRSDVERGPVVAGPNGSAHADGVRNRLGPGQYNFHEVRGHLPSSPVFSAPCSPRFQSRAALDVDPKWTAEHDAVVWARTAKSFPRSPRTSLTVASVCDGNYFVDSNGPKPPVQRSTTAPFRSKTQRFKESRRLMSLASAPEEPQRSERDRQAGLARSARLMRTFESASARDAEEDEEEAEKNRRPRPTSVFILPTGSKSTRSQPATRSARELGPGQYNPWVQTKYEQSNQARPSSVFRLPQRRSLKSSECKKPQSTWTLQTDSRHWTKSSRVHSTGFPWTGGRDLKPIGTPARAAKNK
eukprot:COSAG05_NODE_3340_length_2141_cov_2.229677_1_plen_326_part_00